MQKKELQFDGALSAARYAYMPNKLKYCGGDNATKLLAYIEQRQSDPGLDALLKEFATMYPYLKLIASANKIANPFDYQVVEAYWLGNKLLENVSMNNFYSHLVDGLQLKKKYKLSLLEKVFGKIPLGAKPHHNFHVFNLPKRTGHSADEHTVETMDKCRVAFAKIKENHFDKLLPCFTAWKQKKIKNNQNLIQKVKVEYQPLLLKDNELSIGEPLEKEVWAESNDKAYSKKIEVGDWVAIHWDWICDVITEKQVDNLRIWTDYNLALTNFIK